jgi:hypothetical protein
MRGVRVLGIEIHKSTVSKVKKRKRCTMFDARIAMPDARSSKVSPDLEE